MTGPLLPARAHPVRRAPLVAEITVLVAMAAVDLGATLVASSPAEGPFTAGFSLVTPAIGTGAGALAVLRRRFDRIRLITIVVAGASLLVSVSTAVAGLMDSPVPAQPPMTEAFALALLAGAACHRLPARFAWPLALLAGAAMTAAPLLRFGIDSRWAFLAVPVALLWGGSIGVGLVLRDADVRRRADLAAAREAERLALARDLHDFVAHHITGIVVLAQGAQVAAARAPAAGRPDPAVCAEIEQAGGAALTAMRRLVGMLRTDGESGLRRSVVEACGNDSRVRLTVADGLDEVAVPVELVTTAHRVVLEAVTNARRYATAGTAIDVAARVEREGFLAVVVLDIVNPASPPAAGGTGYGLLGMAERVEAIGGTLSAGPAGEGRWRVTARLPAGVVARQPAR